MNDLQEHIMRIVDQHKGAFWHDFHRELTPVHDADDVLQALRGLVDSGELRTREDDEEHALEYIRTKR